MHQRILLSTIITGLAFSSYCQQVSQMNKFNYNNRWNIKKGDSIHLGKPSDETFKFIFDSPSDRKNKGYLPKSSTGKSYKVETIKRYVWSSDVENVYLLIEDNGESYFVDLYDAVQNDEVTLPEGVRKMTLVGADGGILPMKNGAVFFEKVIEVKDKNKEQIHAALRKWFADYFRDSKSVIQVSDKEEGLITGKGNYSFYLKQTVMMTPISGRVDFTININIKDNKFKYQIYGFAIEAAYKSVLPILKTQIDPVIKSSYQSQTFEEIAQAVALNNNTKYCNAMIEKLLSVTSMIDESLKEAANTATDDW